MFNSEAERLKAIGDGLASGKYFGYSDPKIARDGLAASDGQSMAWWSETLSTAGREMSDFFTRGLSTRLEGFMGKDGLLQQVQVDVRTGLGIHGNDASSMKVQVIYKLVEKGTGRLLKWGITSLKNPLSRYSKTYYDRINAEMIKVRTVIGRRFGLDIERDLIEKEPGPLNKERWRK